MGDPPQDSMGSVRTRSQRIAQGIAYKHPRDALLKGVEFAQTEGLRLHRYSFLFFDDSKRADVEYLVSGRLPLDNCVPHLASS